MPPGCRAISDLYSQKTTGLGVNEVAKLLENDWKPSSDKGYYVTGRLNTAIYRDDVLFSGPDPDMPVRGLRKYLGAASHLFDSKKSHAELLSLHVIDSKTIKATWQLEGVLMLPWRPTVPSWRGTTLYHLDKEGLIYHHEEQWDKSVLEAFVTTLWPNVGRRIWKTDRPVRGIPSQASELQ